MTGLSSKTITYAQLAKVIDHSLLRPELTEQEVVEGCKLAARYNTATVCVKPTHVKLAAEVLERLGCEGQHGGRVPAWEQPDGDESGGGTGCHG